MSVIESPNDRAGGIIKALAVLGIAALAGCHIAPGAGREMASTPPPPPDVSVKDDAETKGTTDTSRDGNDAMVGTAGVAAVIVGTAGTTSRRRRAPGPVRGSSFVSPELGAIQVEGTRVTDFHYLRDDLFRDLGNSDAARKRRLQRSRAFGPFATGNAVDVFVGDIYYFFPVCGGRVRIERRQSGQILAANQRGTVRLTCP